MKRLIAITVTLTVISPYVASAQVSSTVPLAEVARKEEERRKTARKATRVYTNANLGANEVNLPPASMPSFAGGTEPAPGDPPATPGGGAEQAPDGTVKDQKYWAGRMAKARADLERLRLLGDSLQTRVNVITADSVNLDYPAKGVADKARASTLAELDRVKKEIEAATKMIAAIEDEARRAGVPPGWLRP
jgi:hypothetical protein